MCMSLCSVFMEIFSLHSCSAHGGICGNYLAFEMVLPLYRQQPSWAPVVVFLSFSAWWLIHLGRTLGLSFPLTLCYLAQLVSFLLANVTWWAQGFLPFLSLPYPAWFLLDRWVMELFGKFWNFGSGEPGLTPNDPWVSETLAACSSGLCAPNFFFLVWFGFLFFFKTGFPVLLWSLS